MQVNRAGAEKTETGTEEGAWRHRQEARNRERKQKNRAGAAKTDAGGRKQGQEAKKCGQEALSIEHFSCIFTYLDSSIFKIVTSLGAIYFSQIDKHRTANIALF
jgi:hypothetical protein